MRGAVGASLAALAAPFHCPPAPPYPIVRSPPHYRLEVRVPARGAVTGSESVSFRLPRASSRVVLRLWANAPVTRHAGARLTVRMVAVPQGARGEGSSDPTRRSRA